MIKLNPNKQKYIIFFVVLVASKRQSKLFFLVRNPTSLKSENNLRNRSARYVIAEVLIVGFCRNEVKISSVNGARRNMQVMINFSCLVL